MGSSPETFPLADTANCKFLACKYMVHEDAIPMQY